MRRRATVVLSGALFVLLAQAFIPMEEFVHRGDDAFYYFGVARNFADAGFWTFDGIHSTNGVQPLWAVVLTAVAVPLNWFGVDGAETLARIFVGITAVFHFASSILLFHVLARRVSVGTAAAAAGAFLFPLGIVWARLWGMENSLYAFTLIATVAYFELSFRGRPSAGKAAVLGLLLGLTALSRLNAGLLVACLLGYFLLAERRTPRPVRMRLAALAAGVAALVVLPYYVSNYVATDHLLPISGTVKKVETERILEAEGIDSRLSPEYLEWVARNAKPHVTWFVSSRAADGLWAVGGRAVFGGAPRFPLVAAILLALAVLPLALGRPREWLRFLGERFARLRPFAYVLVFGVLNAALSVFLYPTEIGYAMIRWWLAENEIVIVVLVATLLVATLAYIADRFLTRPAALAVATVGLTVLLGFHAVQTYRFYWDGTVEHRDWNLSWNDESLRAARWMEENLPPDARVGSWNAGVVGYYSKQPVINLDGLINNFEYLTYIEQGRTADYIRKERIAYLSDMEDRVERLRLRERLKLRLVYSHYSEFVRKDYRIYRVLG